MSAPLRLRSGSPEDTRRVAAAVAAQVRPGDVVALSGELGAGKTCFVQGLAAGMGIGANVTSPTFTLVRTYPGVPALVHVDVYRLDALQDVLDLGDEVMDPEAVTCIEWGDAVGPLLPEDRLDVEIVVVDEHRDVTLVGLGDWAPRVERLRGTLDGPTARGA